MFTLGDPRARAWESAAGQFGGGLGEQLGRSIESRSLNRALDKAGPDASATELTKILSRYSPEMQQLALNPMIQNRIMQERMAKKFEDIQSKYPKLTPENMPEYLREITQARMLQPGADIGDAFTSLQNSMARSGAGKAYQNKRKSSPGGEQVKSSEGLNEPFLGGQYQQQPQINKMGATQQGQQGQPVGFTGTIEEGQRDFSNPQIGPVKTRVPTQQEYANLYSEGYEVSGDPNFATQYADKGVQLTKDQIEQEWRDQNATEAGRQASIAEEDRLREFANKKLDRDFPKLENSEQRRGLDPFAEDALVMGILSNPGSPDQRYNKAKSYAIDVHNALEALSTGESRPNLAAFRGEKLSDFLKKQENVVQTVLKDPRTPERFRRRIMDKFRTQLIASGDGMLEAEQIVNPMDDNSLKIVNSAPKAPKKTVFLNNYIDKPNPKYEEERESGIGRITDLIIKSAKQNTYASPLMFRHYLIKKGWDEKDVAEAYKNASPSLSDYQRSQVAQFSTQEKPGLNTIFFGGDTSQQSLLDELIRSKK